MIKREEVESLLETLTEIRQPNQGIFAELCRTWLAVQDAPVVKVKGKVGEFATVVVSHSLSGKRVRLVPEVG